MNSACLSCLQAELAEQLDVPCVRGSTPPLWKRPYQRTFHWQAFRVLKELTLSSPRGRGLDVSPCPHDKNEAEQTEKQQLLLDPSRTRGCSDRCGPRVGRKTPTRSTTCPACTRSGGPVPGGTLLLIYPQEPARFSQGRRENPRCVCQAQSGAQGHPQDRGSPDMPHLLGFPGARRPEGRKWISSPH